MTTFIFIVIYTKRRTNDTEFTLSPPLLKSYIILITNVWDKEVILNELYTVGPKYPYTLYLNTKSHQIASWNKPFSVRFS